MAHLEKFTRAGAGLILYHDARQQGDGIQRSNENIDDSRTHLNYNLALVGDPIEIMHKRLSEVRCLKRKDVKVLLSWVITLPKDFTGDEEQFFRECYSFLAGRYGQENVVSAWVHKDETQPHLHFKFVPVVRDGKGTKVCAHDCCNRADLRAFHVDLKKHLETALHCPCHVLNGATDGGNMTVQALKAEKLKEQIEEIEKTQEEKEQMKKQLEQMAKEISELKLRLGDDKDVEEKETEQRSGLMSAGYLPSSMGDARNIETTRIRRWHG